MEKNNVIQVIDPQMEKRIETERERLKSLLKISDQPQQRNGMFSYPGNIKMYLSIQRLFLIILTCMYRSYTLLYIHLQMKS